MVSNATGRTRGYDGRQEEDGRTDTEGNEEWRFNKSRRGANFVDAEVIVHQAQKSCSVSKGTSRAQ